MSLAVWATSASAPLNACANAALPGGLSYPDGDASGQAGWDVSVPFDRAPSLASNLAANDRIKGNLIDRLAINAHGDPGHFDIDSQCTSAMLQGSDDIYRRMLSPGTMAQFRPALDGITKFLAAHASVLLMGCNAGRDAIGSSLLIELSKIWPGRSVTAFTTIGLSVQRGQAGRFCQIPGMRDTDFERAQPEGVQRYTDASILNFKWAHEHSGHAKTALDGVITRDPTPNLAQDPSAYIGGTSWGWRQVAKTPNDPEIIIFMFLRDGTCSWQGYRFGQNNEEELTPVTRKWPGTWRVENGKVVFEFPSDPPAYYRIWTVDELGQSAKVSVRIKGVLQSTIQMNNRTLR